MNIIINTKCICFSIDEVDYKYLPETGEIKIEDNCNCDCYEYTDILLPRNLEAISDLKNAITEHQTEFERWNNIYLCQD